MLFYQHAFPKWLFQNLIQYDPVVIKFDPTYQKDTNLQLFKLKATKLFLGLREQSSQLKIALAVHLGTLVIIFTQIE